MKKRILSITAICLALVACNSDKEDSDVSDLGSVTSLADLKVPSGFNWSASRNLTTDISIVGIEGKPMSKIRVDIYDKDAYEGGEILWSGFTNDQGELNAPIKLPSRLTEVVVHAKAMGMGNNRITASVTGDQVKAHFSGVPGNRMFKKNSAAGGTPSAATNFGASPFGANVYHLGPFDTFGVPTGVGSVPIAQAYIDDLNMTLPENNNLVCDPVRQHFLNDLYCNQVTTSKDDADVWVTFLTEGAGYKNSLAYYYYPAGSPPATVGDIDSVFVIFPNVTHSNNNLHSGDRVYLGNFPKNTVIEWVLLARTWDNADDEVEYGFIGTDIYFGEDDFNFDQGVPTVGCSDPAFNQHMISLTDDLNGEEIQIFAFEDLKYPGGDYDFNDCVFYASGDLYESCAPRNAIPQGAIVDTDGDGIIDQLDDEPNNPDVACLIDYEGTLMFEDLWPSKGDYDFNDMVATYEITHAIHAQGYVHEVRSDYTIKAVGAGYDNGFGVLMSDDIFKTDIVSITGRPAGVPVNPDGALETTPTDVVYYNWAQTKNLISNDISGGKFFNTVIGGGKGNCVTENIVITFAAGNVEQWELGLPPYNTFIYSNQDISREIHLADMRDSELNDNTRFGTRDDDSNPGAGRYYKTVPATNLPWALDIPYLMDEWPLERTEILTAFPDFAAWASTGGAVNTDWYLPANSADAHIYTGCP